MIKKVKIELLEPGVFVHDFNSDRRSSNLITSQTLIRDRRIVEILGSMGIREVNIDTDKGIDVQESIPALEVRTEIEEGLHELAAKQPDSIRNIPLTEELAVARKIKSQAVSVIRNVIESVRKGKPLETGEAFHLVEEMENSVTRNRDALVLLTMIRKKDEYTMMHSISVGAYILNFCNFYKVQEQQTLNLAIGALFHDIGKTRIPHAILNKPGPLDEKEFAIMKKHAQYSAEILQSGHHLPSETFDMGLHHHERYDGTGYPHHLKGEQISFGSQLAAIADVYDALTSDRCYKAGIDRVEALRKLYEWSGLHFNKDLTHQFIRCIGVYPIGSCVTLASGRVGIVVGSTESLIQPIVHIFYDKKKEREITIPELDLSQTEDQVVGYEESCNFDLKKLDAFKEVATDIFHAA
ncbi:MAG: HD-GYP domain-containing protein [Deltaproteobacteria bacterium]